MSMVGLPIRVLIMGALHSQLTSPGFAMSINTLTQGMCREIRLIGPADALRKVRHPAGHFMGGPKIIWGTGFADGKPDCEATQSSQFVSPRSPVSQSIWQRLQRESKR